MELFSQTRSRRSGGDPNQNQHNAFLFSQPENVLSQRSSLDQLLREILESPMDELVIDYPTAVKLLGVIFKSGLDYDGKQPMRRLDDQMSRNVIMSLDAIKRLMLLMPDALDAQFEESGVKIYESLLYRIITLFSFESKSVNTRIGLFIKHMLIVTMSTSNLWNLSKNIQMYLHNILNKISKYLEMNSSDHFVFPEPLDHILLQHDFAVDFMLTIIQAFLRAVSTNRDFQILYGSEKLHQLRVFSFKVWNHLRYRLPISGCHVSETHQLFSNMCSIALSIASGRKFWFRLSISWSVMIFNNLEKIGNNSDIEIAASVLVLDLIDTFISYGSIGASSSLLPPLDKLDNFSKTDEFSKALFIFTGIFTSSSLSERSELFTNYFTFKSSFLQGKALSIKTKLANTRFIHTDAQIESEPFASLFNISFILEPINDLGQLKNYISTKFSTLQDFEKFWIIRRVGYSACFLHGSLQPSKLKCSLCDISTPIIKNNRSISNNFSSILLYILSNSNVSDKKRFVLEFSSAFRRILTSNDIEFDLNTQNPLGNWLISNIKSPDRQVRLITSSLIAYSVTSSYRDIFGFLSSVNESEPPHLIEPIILCWGKIGLIVEGEELNLVLIKLIEYLGIENSFCSRLAIHQIRSIARHLKKTCWDLISPFWSSVGIAVCKRYPKKPVILTKLCEILEITPSSFIYQTFRYTVPYLVLKHETQALSDISAISNISVSQLIIESMAKTVALLLMHDSSPNRSFVMQCLTETHSPISTSSLAVIINGHRLPIAFELLKMYDPDDKIKSKKISENFEFIDVLLYGNEKSKSSKSTPRESFFEANILGLVTQFTDTIIGTRIKCPLNEKVLSLRGISKLISCSGSSFAKSIPQICAILQAAMENRDLQKYALIAWLDMLKSMTTSDLDRIIDLTFSVIIQKWDEMHNFSKMEAIKLFEYLLHDVRPVMESIIKTRGVPSLSSLYPDLSDINNEICAIHRNVQPLTQLRQLLRRLSDENVYIVKQSLQEIRELLVSDHDSIKINIDHQSSQAILRKLVGALLNIPNQFQDHTGDISLLCTQCIGFLGAIDPSKVDFKLEDPYSVIYNNFETAKESVRFVIYFLEIYLIRCFQSSTDPICQSFLAYGIQEYLKFCELSPASIKVSPGKEYWDKFSSQSKTLLYPLLTSKYKITTSTPSFQTEYPYFTPDQLHQTWLQNITLRVLAHTEGPNAKAIFRLCWKIIKNQDLSIYYFVLPYAAVNVVISGNKLESDILLKEILNVLSYDISKYNDDQQQLDNIKKTYSVIFSMIDHFNRVLRARQHHLAVLHKEKEKEKISKGLKVRPSAPVSETDSQVLSIESVIKRIPSALLAKRSFECKSYSRSLMYWEEYLRENKNLASEEQEQIYSNFMEIYASIDDPDSLDGIVTKFSFLPVSGKILQYEKSGKSEYALDCYKMLSTTSEWNIDMNYNMMKCIKNSGRYDYLMESMETLYHAHSDLPNKFLSIGVEASWLASDFNKLRQWLNRIPANSSVINSFEVNIGRALLALEGEDYVKFRILINKAQKNISTVLESSQISSVIQIYDTIVRLHGLADFESIASIDKDRMTNNGSGIITHREMSKKLNDRLDILGSYYPQKQYLLAFRRMAMNSSHLLFAERETLFTWIYSAKSLRKQEQYPLAFSFSVRSLPSNNFEAYIEYAKLLWAQSDHRGAIKALDKVAEGGLHKYLINKSKQMRDKYSTKKESNPDSDLVDTFLAKSALLQTRWLGMSGQAASSEIKERYELISKVHPKWEKIHYYTAKYYNKLYDSQSALDPSMRTTEYHCGDYITIIVRCYTLSLQFGVKYLYETLPKLITLWLDFSENVNKIEYAQYKSVLSKIVEARRINLKSINQLLERYSVRVPSYIFYNSLPQLYSRLSHADTEVYNVIQEIIVQVTRTYPQQALWFLLGVLNSNRKERKERGIDIMKKLLSTPAVLPSQKNSQSMSSPMTQSHIKPLVESATKMATELSSLCNDPYKQKPRVHIRDIDFDISAIPCGLVMPVGSCMCVTLPSQSAAMKYHTAFPQSSIVTIEGIDPYVDFMSSLQKPKKVVFIGSNGKRYKILCKARDDVRKDARLNDLTRSIDSLLKRDDNSHKRGLSISTYWVTALTENSGLIEWVDGYRPMRDILSHFYTSFGIQVNWLQLQKTLKQEHGFSQLVQTFIPVLKYWFLECFPQPSAWFSARTKYARTLAVMSMVGFILG